jgi:methionyl-tRNA synthetase
VPERADPGELAALGDALPARVDAALAAFLPDEATAAILELVDAANRALDRSAPWRTRDATALYAPLEAARRAAGELAPFVPGVARTIVERLGDAPLAPGAPLVAGPPPVVKRGATS